jgi:hypothetical protein
LDEAIVNPWASPNHLKSDYLSYGEKTVDGYHDAVILKLSDTKIIRQRTVYNIIDLIAEVSGIADILYVFSSTVVVYLITMRALKSELVKHMGQVKLLSRPDKLKMMSFFNAQDQKETAERKLLSEIIGEISMRGILHVNAWMVVVAQNLPRAWRSPLTNRVLDLASESLKRTEAHLDVKRIVDSQIDIE